MFRHAQFTPQSSIAKVAKKYCNNIGFNHFKLTAIDKSDDKTSFASKFHTLDINNIGRR